MTPVGRRRAWLVAVVVTPVAVVAGVLPTAALLGTAALLPRVRAATARRRREAALSAEVAEVADLLSVAVGAGLTVPQAVAAVGRRGTGPLASELAHVAAEAGTGRRLVDALEVLPSRAGEPVRPLAAALLACERDGAPVLPTLAALAVEARDRERRRVEQAARRVPVLLLFPLVLCILPAFALLTVAPLLADALIALRP